MNEAAIEQIRDRTFHSLSGDLAVEAGLSLADLEQFCAGATVPSEPQLRILARRMNVAIEEPA